MRLLLLAGILCLGIAGFLVVYAGTGPVIFTTGPSNIKPFLALAPAFLGILLVTAYIMRQARSNR